MAGRNSIHIWYHRRGCGDYWLLHVLFMVAGGEIAGMNIVYLTRRNLMTLLNKLDRPGSKCTLIKHDTVHPVYPCSDVTQVIALEDDEYYIDRRPGAVYSKDEPSE